MAYRNYFSDTFRTLHGIVENSKISKFNSEELFGFIDTSFLLLDGINSDFISLRTPFNLLISDNRDYFRVFLGSEKAISEFNQIRTGRNIITTERATELGKFNFGYGYDFFIDFRFQDIDKYINKFNEFVDKVDLKETKTSILENYVQDKKFNEFLDFLIEQYKNEIRKVRKIMEFNPKFKARNLVVKDNQAFYILPFTNAPLEAMTAIKKALKEKKINCDVIKSEDRFDPTRGNNIVENIWQDICTSKFIIADLSEKNPNVFYELGICDTLGKIVVPICSKRSRDNDYKGSLPFDIASEYTIFYDENFTGYSSLQEDVLTRIKTILGNDNQVDDVDNPKYAHL
ncbi:hypothetical protein [Liquorilactobacillus hordei]|uniref:hypothetical protein n=1 Tax=Liquorilactobacillus hordei TaxID=468911 RepID=UPI0039EC2E10